MFGLVLGNAIVGQPAFPSLGAGNMELVDEVVLELLATVEDLRFVSDRAENDVAWLEVDDDFNVCDGLVELERMYVCIDLEEGEELVRIERVKECDAVDDWPCLEVCIADVCRGFEESECLDGSGCLWSKFLWLPWSSW
jgi:hypothetical protein